MLRYQDPCWTKKTCKQRLFERRRVLNYLPEAKWLALVSSVVSGLLYVVLLVILALFVELMVNQGSIPMFRPLAARREKAIPWTTRQFG